MTVNPQTAHPAHVAQPAPALTLARVRWILTTVLCLAFLAGIYVLAVRAERGQRLENAALIGANQLNTDQITTADAVAVAPMSEAVEFNLFLAAHSLSAGGSVCFGLVDVARARGALRPRRSTVIGCRPQRARLAPAHTAAVVMAVWMALRG